MSRKKILKIFLFSIAALFLVIIVAAICINEKYNSLWNLSVMIKDYNTVIMDSTDHIALLEAQETAWTEIKNGESANYEKELLSYMIINRSEQAQDIKQSNYKHPILFSAEHADNLNTTAFEIKDGTSMSPQIICKDTQKDAEEIILFYKIYNKPVYGGGYSRTAYICESEYIVNQWLDPILDSWSGPYKLK